jgi:two-component system, chemotaxis family, sensor kinase CheA
MSDENDEIVREFLVESNEKLDQLDCEFVELEKDPANLERIAGLFRTVHTIKGTCGFLGFKKLESLAHGGENLLNKLRDGAWTLRPEITTALLHMVDAIRQMLDHIARTGAEGMRDGDAVLLETLSALAREDRLSSPPAAIPAPSPLPPEKESPSRKISPLSIGEILINENMATAADVASAMQIQRQGDPRHLGEILVQRGVVKPEQIVEALRIQQATRVAAGESSIRVDVALLDKLITLVGELLPVRDEIVRFASTDGNAAITNLSRQLDLVTTELQAGVAKTRMQSIGSLWSHFPRTIRDVAVECGKRIRIQMFGDEIELDKTIIEAIKDPLMHIVRNAVDHGIESPAQRAAMGKASEGLLCLRAYYQGDRVIIEISDDGVGLDREKIRRKAVDKSLITREQSLRISECDLFSLIFLPGFSTAETVTNISGRGVGLDVVKTNVEAIGGTVNVQSQSPTGTIVRMKIPRAMAGTSALLLANPGARVPIQADSCQADSCNDPREPVVNSSLGSSTDSTIRAARALAK